MVKKYTITFKGTDTPISVPSTKFGGQPTWIEQPQWPLSRATGERMRFICQISLDADVFGELAGRMVYLFLSDGETFVDNTYDPEGGENAIIIQPAGICSVQTQPLSTGPTLQQWLEQSSGQEGAYVDCEFAVELQPGEDPDTLDENESFRAGQEAWEAFMEYWDENKIGGTPAFLQGPVYPAGGPWKLLLQLNAEDELFYVNFGDTGIGYAFISEDGKQGKFLWQCV